MDVESKDQLNLPEFAAPPLVETVLGFQFPAIRGLSAAHLGAYWKSIVSDWPHAEDAPPLPNQFETFDVEGRGRMAASFRLHSVETPRLRIRNASQDQMIQVQSTRFHYNWIGHASDAGERAYIRYPACRAAFLEHWLHFKTILESEKLTIDPCNQWELTYVNHLAKGALWEGLQDWGRIFGGLAKHLPATTAVTPEDMAGEWRFRMRDCPGRLYLRLQRKLKQSEPRREMLELMLTARGPIDESSQTEAMMHCLDQGHHAIVQTFAEMTTEEAHTSWERQQ